MKTHSTCSLSSIPTSPLGEAYNLPMTAKGPGGGAMILQTPRGGVEAIYHPAPDAQAGVIWVGGTDGGVDGPADAIYPTLASSLASAGIASLRVAYRVLGSPGNLREAVHDVESANAHLKTLGIRRVGLVGHSFGGAVVIEAASRLPEVQAVVALSTQTAGAEAAPRLAPRPLLLVHGEEDQRLPPWCSKYVLQQARQPKELVLLPGARHSLRQRREELRVLLETWLAEKLGASDTPGP